MRVAILPDWREGNPYQQLLADVLTPLGVEVVFPKGYRRGMPLSRALLPRPRVDLLHLHWPTPYLRSDQTFMRGVYCLRTLADIALVRKAGIPVVWTVHNLVTHDTPTPQLERWFSSRLAALVDGLIVHSETAAQEVVRELGAPREKISVIPHGPLRDAYGAPPSRAEARKALNLPEDVPLAMFFGLVRPYKGVLNLLVAWEALGDRRGGARLLIAGDAPDPDHANEVRSQAEGLPGVRLDLQRIPDEDVPVLMAAADLLVMPFEKSLTSGTVRLAEDYGVPVVVPKVGGSAEANDVIYAEGTSPKALSNALSKGLAAWGTAKGSPPSPVGWTEIAEAHWRMYQHVELAVGLGTEHAKTASR